MARRGYVYFTHKKTGNGTPFDTILYIHTRYTLSNQTVEQHIITCRTVVH